MAAHATGTRQYRIDGTGWNARLLAEGPPGLSAVDLVEALLAQPARVVGFDFPFGIPQALLEDAAFASAVGHTKGPFRTWQRFHRWVADHLPLKDPLDFTPFDPWRAAAHRRKLWTKRATDVAAGAQPPLKDKFQATFQMTLLGNAILARLAESRHYRVLPFPGGDGDGHGAGAGDGDGKGAGEAIEVYPGATLRGMGLAHYKSHPDEALRRGIAACTAAGIALDVDPALVARASRYNSGTESHPDHDMADAFVALCTAILHAEGRCHPAVPLGPAQETQAVMEREGAIFVPALPRPYAAEASQGTWRGPPGETRGESDDFQ
jgi:hypothetical protein